MSSPPGFTWWARGPWSRHHGQEPGCQPGSWVGKRGLQIARAASGSNCALERGVAAGAALGRPTRGPRGGVDENPEWSPDGRELGYQGRLGEGTASCSQCL